jgi:hypothetical protein
VGRTVPHPACIQVASICLGLVKPNVRVVSNIRVL